MRSTKTPFYAYVAEVEKGDAIVDCVVGNFGCKHKQILIMGRNQSLDIYEMNDEELVRLKSFKLYGEINRLSKFEVGQRDYLVILFCNFKAIILTFFDDNDDNRMTAQTLASVDLMMVNGRETGNGNLIEVDPRNRMIALHQFDGILTYIPIHIDQPINPEKNRHCYWKVLHTLINSMDLVDMKFLHGYEESTLAIIRRVKGNRLTYSRIQIDINRSEILLCEPSEYFLLDWYELKKERPHIMISIKGPMYGVFIVDRTGITYLNDNLYMNDYHILPIIQRLADLKERKKFEIDMKRLLRKFNRQIFSTNLLKNNEILCYVELKVTEYLLLSNNGSMYRLSMDCMEVCQGIFRPTNMKLKFVRDTTLPQTMSLLNDHFLFISSRLANHELYHIDDNGQLRLMKTFNSNGPLADVCLIKSDNYSSDSLIMACNAHRHGCVKVMRKMVRTEKMEKITLESELMGIDQISNMFPIRIKSSLKLFVNYKERSKLIKVKGDDSFFHNSSIIDKIENKCCVHVQQLKFDEDFWLIVQSNHLLFIKNDKIIFERNYEDDVDITVVSCRMNERCVISIAFASTNKLFHIKFQLVNEELTIEKEEKVWEFDYFISCIDLSSLSFNLLALGLWEKDVMKIIDLTDDQIMNYDEFDEFRVRSVKFLSIVDRYELLFVALFNGMLKYFQKMDNSHIYELIGQVSIYGKLSVIRRIIYLNDKPAEDYSYKMDHRLFEDNVNVREVMARQRRGKKIEILHLDTGEGMLIFPERNDMNYRLIFADLSSHSSSICRSFDFVKNHLSFLQETRNRKLNKWISDDYLISQQGDIELMEMELVEKYHVLRLPFGETTNKLICQKRNGIIGVTTFRTDITSHIVKFDKEKFKTIPFVDERRRSKNHCFVRTIPVPLMREEKVEDYPVSIRLLYDNTDRTKTYVVAYSHYTQIREYINDLVEVEGSDDILNDLSSILYATKSTKKEATNFHFRFHDIFQGNMTFRGRIKELRTDNSNKVDRMFIAGTPIEVHNVTIMDRFSYRPLFTMQFDVTECIHSLITGRLIIDAHSDDETGDHVNTSSFKHEIDEDLYFTEKDENIWMDERNGGKKWSDEYFFVGTSFASLFEDEVKIGRIVILKWENNELIMFREKLTNGAVHSLNIVNGCLVATVNASTRMFKLSGKELKLECIKGTSNVNVLAVRSKTASVINENDIKEIKEISCTELVHRSFINNSDRNYFFSPQTEGKALVLVGDLCQTVSLYAFNAKKMCLQFLAHDRYPSWCNDMDFLDFSRGIGWKDDDDDLTSFISILAADGSGNLILYLYERAERPEKQLDLKSLNIDFSTGLPNQHRQSWDDQLPESTLSAEVSAIIKANHEPDEFLNDPLTGGFSRSTIAKSTLHRIGHFHLGENVNQIRRTRLCSNYYSFVKEWEDNNEPIIEFDIDNNLKNFFGKISVKKDPGIKSLPTMCEAAFEDRPIAEEMSHKGKLRNPLNVNSESLLLMSVSGALHAVYSISYEIYQILKRIETIMTAGIYTELLHAKMENKIIPLNIFKEIQSTISRTHHIVFRSFHTEREFIMSETFIDGSIVEKFILLPFDVQKYLLKYNNIMKDVRRASTGKMMKKNAQQIKELMEKEEVTGNTKDLIREEFVEIETKNENFWRDQKKRANESMEENVVKKTKSFKVKIFHKQINNIIYNFIYSH
ncbi:hypothetical protein SNEBB_003804 [Seison nebaliae]|nr:hypothetical protein SNEBB_003804 [Seison nebaliae]